MCSAGPLPWKILCVVLIVAPFLVLLAHGVLFIVECAYGLSVKNSDSHSVSGDRVDL